MQRRRFLFSGLLAGFTAAAVPAFAQASPPRTVSATIAGKNIKIDYYAPSMRGRKIFGSLVPYDEVWCPGANWATAITAEAGLEIGAMKLPAGSYALWVLPNEREWQAILNRDAKAFHLDYRADKDIGRLKMNLKTLDAPVEQLTFEIRGAGGNKGTFTMLWEKTEASIPFTVVP
jgi:hypothetical protein